MLSHLIRSQRSLESWVDRESSGLTVQGPVVGVGGDCQQVGVRKKTHRKRISSKQKKTRHEAPPNRKRKGRRVSRHHRGADQQRSCSRAPYNGPHYLCAPDSSRAVHTCSRERSHSSHTSVYQFSKSNSGEIVFGSKYPYPVPARLPPYRQMSPAYRNASPTLSSASPTFKSSASFVSEMKPVGVQSSSNEVYSPQFSATYFTLNHPSLHLLGPTSPPDYSPVSPMYRPPQETSRYIPTAPTVMFTDVNTHVSPQSNVATGASCHPSRLSSDVKEEMKHQLLEATRRYYTKQEVKHSLLDIIEREKCKYPESDALAEYDPSCPEYYDEKTILSSSCCRSSAVSDNNSKTVSSVYDPDHPGF